MISPTPLHWTLPSATHQRLLPRHQSSPSATNTMVPAVPTVPTTSSSSLLPSSPLLLHRPRLHFCRQTLSFPTSFKHSHACAALSDPFVLEVAEKLEDALPSPPSPSLRRLRESSTQSLLSKPFPSQKLEAFRFTDTSFLRTSNIVPAPSPVHSPSSPPSAPPSISAAIVDGHFSSSLSHLSPISGDAYVGPLDAMPRGAAFDRVLEVLDRKGGSFSDGDVFWDLNGVGAPDVVVVYVPKEARVVEGPVYLRFYSGEAAEDGEGRLPVSNPRVVVVAEERAEVGIVEEHLGLEAAEERCYWANVVVEIAVGEGARVEHSYVQRQSRNAAHIKWTSVHQESSSSYQLVDISTGSRLSRHNLHIQQLGPDTVTELSAFHLSQSKQIQDLHSKLVLDHPRGYSRQIHKSIVTNSSGQIVFDGNIKVNRFAQQTDAGQLTRTLLLAPRATANVKPNLQIIADDVKCSHGAAISDLEDDQLFYFQARGIDLQSARDALIFSFGAEIVARLPYQTLKKEVSSHIKKLLATRDSLQ